MANISMIGGYHTQFLVSSFLYFGRHSGIFRLELSFSLYSCEQGERCEYQYLWHVLAFSLTPMSQNFGLASLKCNLELNLKPPAQAGVNCGSLLEAGDRKNDI